VREKLTKLRQRILNGEDFAGIARRPPRTPFGAGRRRPGMDGPAHSCPSSTSDRGPQTERDQRAVQDALWLAHRADAGTRTYDSTDDAPPEGFRRHPREQADEETELWLRRLRDEAFVEVKM